MPHTRLQISANRRFLVRDDGTPFFYLADTAWELFHRLNRAEADLYLRTRAAQGFTVIQAVVLAELDGLSEPTPDGHRPLHDNDPTRPDEHYFRHVDWVVDRAAALGLTVGMLPTWGDKWIPRGVGPVIFTPQNAGIYGRFLGARYRNRPIIWILGGDRPVETDAHLQVHRAMAAGIREGDGGNHLMTFHPPGGHTSADWVHTEPWLDFNMCQTGHHRFAPNHEKIAADYSRVPTKPCMDAEPTYEDHPSGHKIENGYVDEHAVRAAAYWALFAGAHGHTYGCHDVWQFWQPGRVAKTWARTPWRQALDLPGAWQMRHARALLESRPFLTRIPDRALVRSETHTGPDHIQACRDADGSYGMVYLPTGSPVVVDGDRLTGDTLRGWWYDPRLGAAWLIGDVTRKAELPFIPPASGYGNDWVLVLDDATHPFASPGQSNWESSEPR